LAGLWNVLVCGLVCLFSCDFLRLGSSAHGSHLPPEAVEKWSVSTEPAVKIAILLMVGMTGRDTVTSEVLGMRSFQSSQ
jgi:hypothetical protein